MMKISTMNMPTCFQLIIATKWISRTNMETCSHVLQALSMDTRRESGRLSSASFSNPRDWYSTSQYTYQLPSLEGLSKNLAWFEYLSSMSVYQSMRVESCIAKYASLPAPMYEMCGELSSISTVWPPFASAIEIVRPASPQPIIRMCYVSVRY